MLIRRLALATALLLPVHVFAGDPVAGRTVFSQQCALCHSAEPGDNGGAQGPSLRGLFERHAAVDERFSYSQALRNADLIWDAETLDRFLEAPTAVVPGSSMVVPVASDEDRENLIAYFEALSDGSMPQPEAPRGFPGGGFGFGPPPAPAAADADWRKDEPGRVHRIDVASLPEPFATPSANNFPQLVPRPEGAELRLPPGFTAEVFTTDVENPRVMRIAPNGDIFLAETQSGRIRVLRPSEDGASVVQNTVYAQGLLQPMGLQFFPAGDNPRWLYVAENNRVIRYPYREGDSEARAVPEIVVPELSPTAGGHYTRDLVFSLDGTQMFVSVGSMTNVPENLPPKTAEDIAEWEAGHGLGALWGDETRRGAVLVYDISADGTVADTDGRIYATGLRNCVGLSVEPNTGDIWCSTNERDMLGDDLVPDFSTRVVDGGFYGWPWYYMGDYEDPRFEGQRPDLEGQAIVPDVPYRAHSASNGLEFYTATRGSSAFPKEYVGDGFAVLHGSWNRAERTGHKIVRVPLENGVPSGEYIDFMVGFIADDGNPWGRPVSITMASDGSLLVGDDGAHVIYRIAYTGD